MSHPALDLDDTVHQRVRLALLAALMEGRRVEFTFLRDRLDLTDGNLSRHLQVLEDAGYVRSSKGFEGRRPRTWVSVTPLGRQAFRAEIEALKLIVAEFERKRRG
jgi:DNA-binding MarR family transcriptional regulator